MQIRPESCLTVVHIIAPAEESDLSDSILVDGTDSRLMHAMLRNCPRAAPPPSMCKWHEAADRFQQLLSKVWAYLFQTWQRCWRWCCCEHRVCFIRRMLDRIGMARAYCVHDLRLKMGQNMQQNNINFYFSQSRDWKTPIPGFRDWNFARDPGISGSRDWNH